MSATYEINEELLADGEIRLTWTRGGSPKDPLDFWTVPPDRVGRAKAIIYCGGMDWPRGAMWNECDGLRLTLKDQK